VVQGRDNVSFTGSMWALGDVLEQQASHPLRVRLQGRLMDVLDDLAAVGRIGEISGLSGLGSGSGNGGAVR